MFPIELKFPRKYDAVAALARHSLSAVENLLTEPTGVVHKSILLAKNGERYDCDEEILREAAELYWSAMEGREGGKIRVIIGNVVAAGNATG